MIEQLWKIEIQIVPVLLSVLVVELPNWFRKFKKLYYIPIYFSIFPLRELNSDLSIYLGDDYFEGYGGDLTEENLKKLKSKIRRESIFSIIISALLIPLIAGFVFAFYLPRDILIQSIIFIGVYKLYNIIRAIIGFKYHAISTLKNKWILSVLYFGYLGVFIQMLLKSYNWTYQFTVKNDWSNLLSELSDLIFNKAIVQFLLLALLSAIFTNMIADKDIRDENIRENY